MEISFTELKEKEIINMSDGKKLGRIIDIVFESLNGSVMGVVVPGEKKLLRRSEDIFIPLNQIKKIGGDVVLVGLKVNQPGGVRAVNSYENYGQNVFVSDSKLQKRSVIDKQKEGYFNTKISTGLDEKNKNLNKQAVVSFVRYKRIDNKKYK